MSIKLHDFKPNRDHYYVQVIEGLQKPSKTLPNFFLFDEQGSALFDQICNLPEYYTARTEVEIMTCYIYEIIEKIGELPRFWSATTTVSGSWRIALMSSIN